MITRRTFISAIPLSLAMPLVVEAQPGGKVWRIGYVSPAPAGYVAPDPGQPGNRWVNALVKGLWERGLIRGQNLVIEERYPEMVKVQAVAAEFVAMNVDLIVTVTTVATTEVKKVTTSVPIVMAAATDPVGAGVVKSLARPGGNITGMTLAGPELAPKRIELLKLIAPEVRRIVVVAGGDHPILRLHQEHVQRAAAALGVAEVAYQAVGARDDGWDQMFAALARIPGTAVLIVESPLVFSNSRRLATLALRHRLPSVYGLEGQARNGWLLSYGPDIIDLHYRAARLISKILLDRAPVSEIPVEQPTNFKLAINAKTAKALGLTIPQSLLMRADEVIE